MGILALGQKVIMVAEAESSDLPWYKRIGSDFVESSVDSVVEPLVLYIKDLLVTIVNGLNANSADIITVALLLCGACMIVTPMLGGNSGVWLGRLMLISVIGVVWRVLI